MKDSLLSNSHSSGNRLNQNAHSLHCNISKKLDPFAKKGFTDAPALGTQSPKNINNTGIPDKLKTGIESLSGYSLDDVMVHYNSAKPAQLQAHAYTQGAEIHLAPGQESHLAHEAWHVVQQKQGRVNPSMKIPDITNLSVNGPLTINNDPALEQEAELAGRQASQMPGRDFSISRLQKTQTPESGMPAQMKVSITGKGTYQDLTTLLNDLRTHIRANNLGKNISAKLKELVTKDLESPDDLPYDNIGAYYDDLRNRLGGGSKGKKKAPQYGEPGYVFTPQTSGKMFECMEGVKSVNSKKEGKIAWGHIGMEREAIKQNACGANNMGYIKSFDGTSVDTIDRETLHDSMTSGQMAGSFIAMELLDSSKLKSSMTELQLVYGVDDQNKEQLMMGGNTNVGNKAFRKFIGANSLSKMYRSKYREENKVKYLEGLETLYQESEEFRKEVASGTPSKKRPRVQDEPEGSEFRKRRKLRNAMKKKPTKTSRSTYGDMELVIPANPKDKHTETNILHYANSTSIKVKQAVGTKVPCLSCFAAYCKEKNSDALLPGFGYLWFSESSIGQHVIDGINAGEFSAEDAVKFLKFIETCLTEYLSSHTPHRYTGNMGDIKPVFDDDDSGSEGEEFFEEFLKGKSNL